MIAAVVLAAGLSRRMGRPKASLPWGDTTVLGQVLATLQEAGLQEIVVVTGGDRKATEALVGALARTAFNPEYARGDMLGSLQCGLRSLHPGAGAALVALADQPLVQPGTVRSLLEAYRRTGATLVVPSTGSRRGHPWLVDRAHWNELLGMTPPGSPRDFFRRHEGDIHYVSVDDPGILQDLDTPEQYERSRPQ